MGGILEGVARMRAGYKNVFVAGKPSDMDELLALIKKCLKKITVKRRRILYDGITKC